MIAALYVDPKGPYVRRPDVDAWIEERDARRYAGPHPVVSHPPCARWGRFWWMAQEVGGPTAPGLGDDGGCFAAALAAVNKWGGVLEHPAGTYAWDAFALPIPGRSCWTRALFHRGWTTMVDQVAYGHRARKRTWLYYAGDAAPPDMDWSRPQARAWVVSGPRGYSAEERADKGISILSKTEKRLTPPAFAEALISLALHSRAEVRA